MTIVRISFPCLLVAGLALAGCASTPAVVDATPEIRAAHDRLVAAYNACDEMSFIGTFAEPFTFITSNTPAPIATRNGLRGYVAAGCRQVPSPQVTVSSQSIKVEGDFGIATGQYVFRISSRGEVANVRQNYTLVLRRVAEGWRVAALHVSLSQ